MGTSKLYWPRLSRRESGDLLDYTSFIRSVCTRELASNWRFHGGFGIPTLLPLRCQSVASLHGHVESADTGRLQ
eukprot:503207-Amphidinium_carterae.1